jgi:serine/threonine protein kinase
MKRTGRISGSAPATYVLASASSLRYQVCTNCSQLVKDFAMADDSPSGQPIPSDIPATVPRQVPIEATAPPGTEPHLPSLVLAPGTQPVPGYELLQQLGQGGFGEVWKAKGPGGFSVALKFIRLGNKPGAVELRSLEVMKDIRHPNLLDVFGAWQLESVLIIAMQLADRSLWDRLQEAIEKGLPGISPPELLEYMHDAAKGIDYLNSLGIQHRDIKPHNLLLVGGGVRIADFGLAKLLEQTIASHSGACSIAYAAPEFFREKTTPQSDQYSLAISYCQLRGGALPFQGNHAAVVAGHLMDPPNLTMLPQAERPAVARALAKKSEERWPDCRSFVQALAAPAAALFDGRDNDEQVQKGRELSPQTEKEIPPRESTFQRPSGLDLLTRRSSLEKLRKRAFIDQLNKLLVRQRRRKDSASSIVDLATVLLGALLGAVVATIIGGIIGGLIALVKAELAPFAGIGGGVCVWLVFLSSFGRALKRTSPSTADLVHKIVEEYPEDVKRYGGRAVLKDERTLQELISLLEEETE